MMSKGLTANPFENQQLRFIDRVVKSHLRCGSFARFLGPSMSPFARQLSEFRMRHGIRQNELAELIGYDQTYISALEVRLKGPPTSEFVDKLVTTLPLTPAEADKT
jgi:hypothetical protein